MWSGVLSLEGVDWCMLATTKITQQRVLANKPTKEFKWNKHILNLKEGSKKERGAKN